jgi:glutathione S-transferase
LGAGLQAIETLLAEHSSSGRFCHGESATVADICLVTQVTPAMTFSFSLDPYEGALQASGRAGSRQVEGANVAFVGASARS